MWYGFFLDYYLGIVFIYNNVYMMIYKDIIKKCFWDIVMIGIEELLKNIEINKWRILVFFYDIFIGCLLFCKNK